MEENGQAQQIQGDAPAPAYLAMLASENATLKSWVRGILEGCEGCTSDATAWRDALEQKVHETHEEEVSV